MTMDSTMRTPSFRWQTPRRHTIAATCVLIALASTASLLQADDVDNRTPDIKRVILTPRETADDFGKRIAQSHLAMQVTVTNNSKQLDMIIQHAGVDLTKALSPARVAQFVKRVRQVNRKLGSGYALASSTKMSSVDLALLQGVAQKGQNYDLRNQAYRLIVAIGTVGAGLVGAAGLGPVLPKAVAAWTGPGQTAFATLFPDLTVDELIRLNDRAYTANTVVPRQKSKVFVVFLPLDLIMTPEEKASYWKRPSDFISIVTNSGTTTPATSGTQPATSQLDLSQIEVETQYDFIVPLTDIPPMITEVAITDKEMDNFTKKAPVHGSIVGRFLDGATVSLPDGAAMGLDIAADTATGTPASGENRLYFVITPNKVVPANTRLVFQVTRDKQVTTFSKLLSHNFPPATLTSLDPAKGSVKSDVPVKLGGSGFLDGDVTILIDGVSDAAASGIKVVNLSVKDTTHLEATFSIDEKAKVGVRQVQIKTSGGVSGVQNFTVQAATP